EPAPPRLVAEHDVGDRHVAALPGGRPCPWKFDLPVLVDVVEAAVTLPLQLIHQSALAAARQAGHPNYGHRAPCTRSAFKRRPRRSSTVAAQFLARLDVRDATVD